MRNQQQRGAIRICKQINKSKKSYSQKFIYSFRIIIIIAAKEQKKSSDQENINSRVSRLDFSSWSIGRKPFCHFFVSFSSHSDKKKNIEQVINVDEHYESGEKLLYYLHPRAGTSPRYNSAHYVPLHNRSSKARRYYTRGQQGWFYFGTNTIESFFLFSYLPPFELETREEEEWGKAEKSRKLSSRWKRKAHYVRTLDGECATSSSLHFTSPLQIFAHIKTYSETHEHQASDMHMCSKQRVKKVSLSMYGKFRSLICRLKQANSGKCECVKQTRKFPIECSSDVGELFSIRRSTYYHLTLLCFCFSIGCGEMFFLSRVLLPLFSKKKTT